MTSSLGTESEKLRKHLGKHYPIGDAAWNAFSAKLTLVKLPAGEPYIDLGDPCDRFGILSSGLLKAYYITSKGDEFIHAFISEWEPCTAYAGALTGNPSSAIFETIEESVILEVSVGHFRSLFEEFPEWNHIGRILIEREYIAKIRRIGELLTLSSQERFDMFVHSNAHLLGRLKQFHVAAYLGIRPESLSRLRANQKRNSPHRRR